MELEIKVLRTIDEMVPLLPLLQHVYTQMTEDTLRAQLAEMVPMGYHLAVAYKEGIPVGVAGCWLIMRFWSGRTLDIDNVVVDPACRNQQIGQTLLTWLDNWAREQGCQMQVLDVYVTNHAAHRLYMRNGFVIKGYHMVKEAAKE